MYRARFDTGICYSASVNDELVKVMEKTADTSYDLITW